MCGPAARIQLFLKPDFTTSVAYRRATHAIVRYTPYIKASNKELHQYERQHMTGGLFKIVMSGPGLQCDGGSNKAGL